MTDQVEAYKPIANEQPTAQTEPTLATEPAPGATVPAPEEKEPERVTASLDLVVFDLKHYPIPNMALRVINNTEPNVRKKVLFDGSTDAKGKIPTIDDLPVGTIFEVQIKRDTGEYKHSATGKIEVAADHTANLKIPRQRFEFATTSHQGSAGLAEEKVKALVSKHSQTPEATPNISRNPPDKKPEVTMERNKDGNPLAVVAEGLKNMFGTNDAKLPNIAASDMEKVSKLIDFATKQATWKHPDSKTSAIIIGQMKQGSYANEGTKDADASVGRCTKYVKIALWNAGYSHNGGDIAPLTSPAKDMGPALEAAGFVNITKKIPDGRWAAPGDVIVYTDKRGAARDGHIDIRTYDGYISDFIGKRLPTSGYVVTGIYRKFYDPLPELRMRAMLDVIASRETRGIEIAKSWYALNTPINDSTFTKNLLTHPWNDLPLPESIKKGRTSTAAGRYQLTLTAWKEANTNGNGLTDFSELTQQRLAVMRLEYRQALGLIRNGSIEAGVKKLLNEWVSLPGGADAKGYSMFELLADYERFLNEYKK